MQGSAKGATLSNYSLENPYDKLKPLINGISDLAHLNYKFKSNG